MKDKLKRVISTKEGSVLIILIGVIIIATLFNPTFLTFTNFMAAAGSGPALYVEAGSASNVVVNGGTTLAELGTCVYFGEYAVGDGICIV